VHIEQNVCNSLIALKNKWKIKNDVNSHFDSIEIKIRENLTLREVGKCTYLLAQVTLCPKRRK